MWQTTSYALVIMNWAQNSPPHITLGFSLFPPQQIGLNHQSPYQQLLDTFAILFTDVISEWISRRNLIGAAFVVREQW